MAEASTRMFGSATRYLRGLAMVLLVTSTSAQAQSILSLLANSLNAELPHSFGNHTRLMRVSATGNTMNFAFEVAPESPLAKGIDVKAQAASLCKVEMFRAIMSQAKAALHITYYRPDHTALSEFTIDRSICRL